MVIALTPQWRAILPMLSVAVVGLIGAAILAAYVAHDRWMDRQIAQMGEAIRQSERTRETAESEGER